MDRVILRGNGVNQADTLRPAAWLRRDPDPQARVSGTPVTLPGANVSRALGLPSGPRPGASRGNAGQASPPTPRLSPAVSCAPSCFPNGFFCERSTPPILQTGASPEPGSRFHRSTQSRPRSPGTVSTGFLCGPPRASVTPPTGGFRFRLGTAGSSSIPRLSGRTGGRRFRRR